MPQDNYGEYKPVVFVMPAAAIASARIAEGDQANGTDDDLRVSEGDQGGVVRLAEGDQA